MAPAEAGGTGGVVRPDHNWQRLPSHAARARGPSRGSMLRPGGFLAKVWSDARPGQATHPGSTPSQQLWSAGRTGGKLLAGSRPVTKLIVRPARIWRFLPRRGSSSPVPISPPWRTGLEAGIRALADEARAQRHAGMQALAGALAARGALKPDLTIAEATDILWLLNDPTVYSRLVIDQGWSPDRYQTWLADALISLLISVEYQPGRPVTVARRRSGGRPRQP